MKQRILIADDEPGITQLLRDYFEVLEFQVITAQNGIETIERISLKPDIILLDVNMPGMDGFEVIKKIRSHVHCPIIFLTARIEEQDRINGLRLGGDDYILKPFSIEELGARVEAHLRREERSKDLHVSPVYMSGNLAINYEGRCVYSDGIPVNLTRTEFNIIELLSMSPGQVFSKEQIYDRARGIDGEGDSGIVTEHIRRIRAKLSAGDGKQYIETVWGVGYRWIG